MLNVPSQSFPAPSSQQRAASGGRSKVPLKQGRSLMDWIRLTKSGKDLTGLKGRLIEVTEEELKKHNTKDDCWICIRGQNSADWVAVGDTIRLFKKSQKTHTLVWIFIGLVYNVSPYMEYHPGGEDELMRAAGSDGTDLFDQVHRWVNYESMLRECLVGRMAVKPAVPKVVNEGIIDNLLYLKIPFSYEIILENKKRLIIWPLNHDYFIKDCREDKKVLNGMLPKSQVTGMLAKESPISPSYDWFQTDSLVTIVIYTKQKDINLDSVIVDHQFDTFRAETIIKDYSYLIHIGLSHDIQEDFSVRVVENVGKIEIVLKKKEHTSWECLGHPLENHNSLILKKDTGLYYRKCQLIFKKNVTHDTKFFCLMLPRSTHLQVPIGQHVYLKLTITGTEIVKPYTPVSDSLLSEFKEPVLPNNKYIYFLIKIDPAGLFTPQLDHLQTGDFVSISSPEGNFKISQFQELEDLFLLAAGTGFTPMVKVLNYALNNVPSLRKAKLMFFNKTEDDIIWRSQLEKLAYKDKRFDVEFVLSAPTSEWNGKTGYISSGLLSEFLKRSSDKSKVLICICGPMPFTERGIRLLHDLNFSKDEIHSFTG